MSEFYDFAESHTYSDWLLAAVIDLGHDLQKEFYRASFPDLSSLVRRFKNRVRVNERELRTALEVARLPLGELLAREVKGRIFIDLGAGVWPRSVVPRLVAEAFGAKRYVAVDLHANVLGHRRQARLLEDSRTEVQAIEEDVEEFLKSNVRGSKLLFIAGLELKKPLRSTSKNVLKTMQRQIRAYLRTGDLLLIGAGTPDFWFKMPDFRLRYSDNYHALFERA